MANYGELISKQRKSKGFSQAQLADVVCITTSSI